MAGKSQEVGLLEQINVRIDKLITATTAGGGTANSPSHQQLVDPSSVTIADWKTLDFVCSGAITVTINSNAIIYPVTLGTSTILGESLKADSVTTNSILFNGTGTVLVTTQQ